MLIIADRSPKSALHAVLFATQLYENDQDLRSIEKDKQGVIPLLLEREALIDAPNIRLGPFLMISTLREWYHNIISLLYRSGANNSWNMPKQHTSIIIECLSAREKWNTSDSRRKNRNFSFPNYRTGKILTSTSFWISPHGWYMVSQCVCYRGN